MRANIVLKVILFLPRIILTPVSAVTTFAIGLTFIVPFWLQIYLFLMTIIWLPFSGYIMSTSWLYQKVFVLRPVLAVISIPILVVLDSFLTLMANPDKADKYNKALIIDSWPFSSWGDIKNMDFMDEWKGLSFALSKSRGGKSVTKT